MDMVISLKPVSGQHGTRRLRTWELPLLGSEQGGRPLVPQPGEEMVSCENMDFDHLRWLGSRRAV
ncbi:hypothetical protein T06_3476 [Trichinella sp. T6]|nr:hypothetical protein T06_3476 [Trichinella sp. T6]